MLRSTTYLVLAMSAGFAGSNASEIVETVKGSSETSQNEITDQDSNSEASNSACESFDKEAAATAKLACEQADSNSQPIECANEVSGSSSKACSDLQTGDVQSLQAKPKGCP